MQPNVFEKPNFKKKNIHIKIKFAQACRGEKIVSCLVQWQVYNLKVPENQTLHSYFLKILSVQFNLLCILRFMKHLFYRRLLMAAIVDADVLSIGSL